jgi:putative uncharacterized protein (fragment)
MEDNKKIELRSEEFQEILGVESPWILRWGILVILITICTFLFISTRISYPNIVKGSVTLLNKHNEGAILFPKNGKLVRVNVTDCQTLNRGSLLIIMTTDNGQQVSMHATSNGIIRLSQDWRAGTLISKNQIFGYVTDSIRDNILGKAVLHSTWNIKVGQKVYVTLTNYPGRIQGQVCFVARVPFEENNGKASYLVTISFPFGIVTTNNIKLPYYSGMKGEVSILTDEVSLFDRILKTTLKTVQ